MNKTTTSSATNRSDLFAAAVDRVVERVWLDPHLRKRCIGAPDMRRALTATIAARLTGETSGTSVLVLTETEARILRDHLLIAMKSLDISETTVEHARVAFDCSPSPEPVVAPSADDASPLRADAPPMHAYGVDAALPAVETVLEPFVRALDAAAEPTAVYACIVDMVTHAVGGMHAAYWEPGDDGFACRHVAGTMHAETSLAMCDDGASLRDACGEVVVVPRATLGSGATVIVPIVVNGLALGWCECWTLCEITDARRAMLRSAGCVAGFRLGAFAVSAHDARERGGSAHAAGEE